MRRNKTARLVTAALMTAACFVATSFISFRSPVQGTVNAGDAIVLVSALTLGPFSGAAAAGVGSALSDLFGGYAVFAPASLLIKALMALCAGLIFRALGKRQALAGALIGALAAEGIMVGGYFLYELLIMGFGAALLELPLNGVQAVFGIAVGTPLYLAVRNYVKV